MKSKVPFTELLYTGSPPIDRLSTLDALNLMTNDHKRGILCIKKNLKKIEEIINVIYFQIKKNNFSRLIYCGAGTSGRIGVQDGVELYPTFNWPITRTEFLIAGGAKALTKSIENAEDNKLYAKKLFKKKKISDKDVIIGLAASGNTPFTCEILKLGSEINALTIGISNNPSGKILKLCKHHIVLNTKQEIIAGSTRLKAGTTQKICLNLISTMLMVKLGKIKDGYMVNLVPNNEKLRKRKLTIDKELILNRNKGR